MNSRTQSFIKYIASILFTIAIVAGGIYAASITNLTQTANSGDTITSQWVNAVNTSSASAAWRYSTSCTDTTLPNATSYVDRMIVCVRTDGLNGTTECQHGTSNAVGFYTWTSCNTPW